MYNTDISQDSNIISNKELKSAFQTIQYIIYQKDEKIKKLEEENLLLKNRLKEYESQRYNKDNSSYENLKRNQSENELTNAFSNSVRENRILRNTSTIQNQKDNSFGIKFQNVSEDYNINPNSPFNALRTQTDHQTINEIKNHYVPVYSNENNVLYTHQNFDTFKSPPRNNQITEENNQSRNEVKVFLNEVREKIPAKEFKEFIKLIKILTDKNNQVSINRKEIFDKVKVLFGIQFRDMYFKFEQLLSIKK
jgi:hypothetical protein